MTDGACVEGHGEALAGPLHVPDDADALVAKLSAGFAACLVAAALLGSAPARRLELCRAQSLGHRRLDGVKLVIARHLLDERSAAIVLEHSEIPHQRKETAWLEDAFQHHL